VNNIGVQNSSVHDAEMNILQLNERKRETKLTPSNILETDEEKRKNSRNKCLRMNVQKEILEQRQIL
jgi:hypothetical protein